MAAAPATGLASLWDQACSGDVTDYCGSGTQCCWSQFKKTEDNCALCGTKTVCTKTKAHRICAECWPIYAPRQFTGAKACQGEACLRARQIATDARVAFGLTAGTAPPGLAPPPAPPAMALPPAPPPPSSAPITSAGMPSSSSAGVALYPPGYTQNPWQPMLEGNRVGGSWGYTGSPRSSSRCTLLARAAVEQRRSASGKGTAAQQPFERQVQARKSTSSIGMQTDACVPITVDAISQTSSDGPAVAPLQPSRPPIHVPVTVDVVMQTDVPAVAPLQPWRPAIHSCDFVHLPGSSPCASYVQAAQKVISEQVKASRKVMNAQVYDLREQSPPWSPQPAPVGLPRTLPTVTSEWIPVGHVPVSLPPPARPPPARPPRRPYSYSEVEGADVDAAFNTIVGDDLTRRRPYLLAST